ncbi:hypothetical protein [Ruegeria arenilitoris]|uniref:hypothetical protein n=1 Tax=Ruegeria arenilitoris TaxID=1173585 RepID=UPI00147DC511|nr:hypothetical protein [Ruegeria arenilitoris]
MKEEQSEKAYVGSGPYWAERSKQEAQKADEVEIEALRTHSSTESKRLDQLALEHKGRSARFARLSERVFQTGVHVMPDANSETAKELVLQSVKNTTKSARRAGGATAKNTVRFISERVRFLIEYLLACIAAALISAFLGDQMIGLFARFLPTFIVSLWHVDRINRNWIFSVLGIVPISALVLFFLPQKESNQERTSAEWRELIKLLITITAFIVICYAFAVAP